MARWRAPGRRRSGRSTCAARRPRRLGHHDPRSTAAGAARSGHESRRHRRRGPRSPRQRETPSRLPHAARSAPLQRLERARPRRALADRLGVDQALAKPCPEVVRIGKLRNGPRSTGPRRRSCTAPHRCRPSTCRSSAPARSAVWPSAAPHAIQPPSTQHESRPMSKFRSDFLNTLDERGFIHQVSHPEDLDARFAGAASPPISASTARPRACMRARSSRS